MRNFMQFPITWREKIALIDELLEEVLRENLIGDIRPSILNSIRENVIKAQQRELRGC